MNCSFWIIAASGRHDDLKEIAFDHVFLLRELSMALFIAYI
jgi:hypothetical protein